MAKIAVVPQNETHALNFAALAFDLKARGHQVNAIVLDALMHQRTAGLFADLPLVTPVGATEAPFYRLGRIEQLNVVRRFKRHNQNLVAGVDLLVIGNDGAIQRVLSKPVMKHGGRVALVVDGNLTPTTGFARNTAIKSQRAMNRLAHWLDIDEYSPTQVGHSSLNSIYVMHPCIKQVLVSQGIEPEKIDVVTLPRHERFLDIPLKKKAQNESGSRSQHVLYATTAFRWHNLQRSAGLQDKEIAEVVGLANTHSEVLFRMRIHPREDKADYDRQYPVNMAVSDSATPLEEDLLWADMLWTSRSSIVFEAEIAGIPCYISTHCFPKPDDSDYLCHASNVHFVPDFGEALRAQGSVPSSAACPAFPRLLTRLLARDLSG